MKRTIDHYQFFWYYHHYSESRHGDGIPAEVRETVAAVLRRRVVLKEECRENARGSRSGLREWFDGLLQSDPSHLHIDESVYFDVARRFHVFTLRLVEVKCVA